MLLLAAVAAGLTPAVFCDPDSDCFYLPPGLRDSAGRVPALLILHCNGASPVDLDTCRFVADSMGWVLASCHASRNRRGVQLNDADIVRTVCKLLTRYPVDPQRVFLFGFSGQGVQALATMFMHPELIRGAVATCAHDGALPLARFDRLQANLAYLVTREQDWNLGSNRSMYDTFNLRGLRAAITTTPGEHGPGPWQEILAGCRWLKLQTRGDGP
ncbi:hypothetical protein FJY71_02345 [candidate division WOR-3 bacterium]|nr:hypothetical protein [candidate division WOR-3 bacterium]